MTKPRTNTRSTKFDKFPVGRCKHCNETVYAHAFYRSKSYTHRVTGRWWRLTRYVRQCQNGSIPEPVYDPVVEQWRAEGLLDKDN